MDGRTNNTREAWTCRTEADGQTRGVRTGWDPLISDEPKSGVSRTRHRYATKLAPFNWNISQPADQLAQDGSPHSLIARDQAPVYLRGNPTVTLARAQNHARGHCILRRFGQNALGGLGYGRGHGRAFTCVLVLHPVMGIPARAALFCRGFFGHLICRRALLPLFLNTYLSAFESARQSFHFRTWIQAGESQFQVVSRLITQFHRSAAGTAIDVFPRATACPARFLPVQFRRS